MKGITGKLLLSTAVILGLAWTAAADKPHMANSEKGMSGKSWKWVSRRANGDANKANGNYAMVVELTWANPRAGSGEAVEVSGTLKFWTGMNYTLPHTYNLPRVPVTHGGEDNYTVEHCKWIGATSPTSGEPAINVYASLFKAHLHGKGDPHRRLVMRFKYPPDGGEKKTDKKGTYDECCESEPDDDVLQEEQGPPEPPDGP